MKGKYKKEDIIRIIDEEGIEFIYLQFTDILGVMKNVAIPAQEISKALNNEVAFDGSCVDGFVRMEESDMYLRPDIDTFCIYPWGGAFGREARFICDVYNPDGTPFEGDPRFILKKVCKEAEDMGYKMYIGPECEFFLFHTDDRGKPTLITHDDAGYFDLAPIDLGENARRDMVMTLKKMGFDIEASHHEIAPGQHEIDFKFEEALYAADKIMTFKSVIKIVAKNHGLHATFMPKPINGIPGSGMHINQALYSNKNNKNVFYDELDKYKLSKIAYNYLGGLIKHAKSICAITNPTVNSYKRLISGYEAPVYITWSSRNTSPLIRVPISKEENTRFELRSPDPSCNPYLALAVILKAGIDGIKNNIMPPKNIDKTINDMDEEYRDKNLVESLPQSLNEAINFLCDDEVIKGALGKHIFERFVEAKKIEWEEYNKSISSWEIEKYLTRF
ncbi:type I glutamate--ammonia ligase [Caloramator sp. E03]|uniref:type I glutamate--ammonia ligase n=1 Tax=Caloramator sp. E03 TaxID=2576307 RepID=UPI0011106964|nr:type I glutamate--ammonia ligase [Caloramator sp. E03]QCX33606.1 type I glutamate--ammonia ligase [Caloramator sp. E03]